MFPTAVALTRNSRAAISATLSHKYFSVQHKIIIPSLVTAAAPTRMIGDGSLTAADFCVFLAISNMAQFEKNGRGCFASHTTIARLANVHQTTVSKCIDKLIQRGYIEASAYESDRRRKEYYPIFNDDDRIAFMGTKDPNSKAKRRRSMVSPPKIDGEGDLPRCGNSSKNSVPINLPKENRKVIETATTPNEARNRAAFEREIAEDLNQITKWYQVNLKTRKEALDELKRLTEQCRRAGFQETIIAIQETALMISEDRAVEGNDEKMIEKNTPSPEAEDAALAPIACSQSARGAS